MSRDSQVREMLDARHWVGRVFEWICCSAIWASLGVLVLLMGATLYRGLPFVSWKFLSSMPKVTDAANSGVLPALVGSLWLMGLTALISVPIGVATAVYLEEYAGKHWWFKFVRTNIANLAGVPSIVYGILGLAVFVKFLALGDSVLAGALTLSLVILPVIIIAAQEALKAVPDSLRHASYALGATRWQTVWYQVLPSALPGIMTGVILALSRAIGEAAPLVAVGAAGYINFVPSGTSDRFTALPLQIYGWSKHSNADFHDLAAGAILVLMGVLVCMNATAIYIRYRYSQNARN